MKSNRPYTLMIRHIFFILAILSFIVGIKGYMVEGSILLNGRPTSLDIYDLTISILISSILLGLWYLMKDKVVEVKLGGQNITILNGKSEELVNWHDVKSLKQLLFVHPPIYRLRIKNKEGYYLFITKPYFISYGFGTVDLSEMGGFLKRKKKQLGL